MRGTILFAIILLLSGAPEPARAVVDIPTTDRQSVEIADLASSSGVARPVDTTVQPIDDAAFLDTYRTLGRRGLIDHQGDRVATWAKARADGSLHLEFLKPQLGLRTYWANDDADGRLLYHAGGDRLASGWNLFANATGAAFWGDRIGGEYDLQFDMGGGGTTGRVKRLYLKGMWGKWSLKVGRDTERWGVGYHGTLLLDDNAPPLDMVRVRTEAPLFFPGSWAKIGGFRFSFLYASLSDPDPTPVDVRNGTGIDPVADANLLGMRMSYHPSSWFDLGFTRMIMFGGDGRETYNTPKSWWELLTATHENVKPGESHRYDNDQYMTFDVTARLPILNGVGPLKGGKVYWEHGGTDLNAPWQGDGWGLMIIDLVRTANVAGLYLSTAVTDLRVEYANLHESWYRHGQYPQGFTYRGRPLGHPMGADSQGWFFKLSRHFGPRWRGWADFRLERRGLSLPETEKRREWGLSLENRALRLGAATASIGAETLYGQISNSLDSPTRADQTDLYLGVRGTLTF